MKRMALDHPKIKRLESLLKIPTYSAVGVLELLWHFTVRHAIRGDVGKWSNPEIASAIGWPADDADRLINALVESRLIDVNQRHRLVIHDWPDHADDSTKKTIQKHGWKYASDDEPTANEAGSVAAVPDQSPTVPESFPTVPEQSVNESDSLSLSLSRSRSLSHKETPAAPAASSEEPAARKRRTYPEAFETWWAVYPTKAGKHEAKNAWESAYRRVMADNGLSAAEAQARLLEAATAFSKTPKGMGQHCPYPATWLNGGRYDDDPNTWQETNGNHNGNGLAVRSDSPARPRSEPVRYRDGNALVAAGAHEGATDAQH